MSWNHYSQTTTGATLAFLPVWAVAAGMVVVAGQCGLEAASRARKARSNDPPTSTGLEPPCFERVANLFGGTAYLGQVVGGAVALLAGILWLAITVHALQCNASGRPQDQLIVQMGAPFELSYLMLVAVPVLASCVWCVLVQMDKCLISQGY